MKQFRSLVLMLAVVAGVGFLASCSSDSDSDDSNEGSANSLIGWWVPADLHSSNWINIFDGWFNWNAIDVDELSQSNHADIQFGPDEGDSYHFIDKNTVEVAVTYLTLDRTEETFATVELPSPMDVWTTNVTYDGKPAFTWHGIKRHYLNAESKRTYTYAVDGNKIYVTNGTILTISNDGTLRRDGYRYSHHKLK